MFRHFGLRMTLVLTPETSVVGRSARALSAKAPSRCAQFNPVRGLSDPRNCVAAPLTHHVNLATFTALPLPPRRPPLFVLFLSPLSLLQVPYHLTSAPCRCKPSASIGRRHKSTYLSAHVTHVVLDASLSRPLHRPMRFIGRI